MSEDKSIIILYFLLGVVFFFLGMLMLMSSSPQGEYKTIPCYDKYGNEIMGVVCEGIEYEEFEFIPGMAIFICLILSGLFFANGIMKNMEGGY